MSITRRGFIGGIVAAVAGGEALVKLASPGEQVLIKAGQPAAFAAEDVPLIAGAAGRVFVAVTLSDGQRMAAVGWLRSISMTMPVDSLAVHELSATHMRRVPELHDNKMELTYFPDFGAEKL